MLYKYLAILLNEAVGIIAHFKVTFRPDQSDFTDFFSQSGNPAGRSKKKLLNLTFDVIIYTV